MLVDRRLHARHPVDFDARVTDITSPDCVLRGRVVDISESGVCTNLTSPMSPGAIVKIEIADCALFGQISYCYQEGSAYFAGLEVVRVLIGDSELARLVNNLLVETLPHTPGVRVA